MKISEWFLSDQNYKEGLSIYENSPFCNSRLLRLLRHQQNMASLKYELNRIEKKQTLLDLHLSATNTPEKKDVAQEAANRKYPKVMMADLPTTLHEPFIKQKAAFYEAARLKIKLNKLPDDDAPGALAIIIKITKLYQLIDRVWQRIDYWRENKTLLPGEITDFSNLSLTEAILTRQLFYQRKTGRKKTINAVKKALETATDEVEILKLRNKLQKKEKALYKLQIDIDELTRKINEQKEE